MQALALGVLSGFLYVLGQPGVDLWPLSLVALVPLLWVIERSCNSTRGYRDSLVAALGCGIVAHVGLFYWLAGAVRDFMGTSLVVGGLSTLGFALHQAGIFVLFAVLTQGARSRGASMTVAATCAMCASEWLYPRVFEQHLGLALHGLPVLLQTADLGGPLMLTALVTAANAAVLVLVCARSAVAGSRREAIWVIAAWLVAAGYGAYRIFDVEQRVRSAETLRVGIVQTNSGVATDREALAERVRLHVAQSLALTRARPIDLLIWPESSFGWFLPEEAKNVREYVDVGRALHTPTLFGALTRRTFQGEKRLFNSAVLAGAHGEVLGIYDKNVLLPIGEHIPLAEHFPALYDWSPRTTRYQAGQTLAPLTLGQHRIGVIICYEDVLPGLVRALVRNGDPQLLVNVTNDAWFGDTLEPRQHLAAAILRSVEHHRSLVRATHSGVSAIVAPTGEVVEQSGVFEPASLAAEVPLLGGQTVYAVAGDLAGPLAWVGLALLWLRRKSSP